MLDSCQLFDYLTVWYTYRLGTVVIFQADLNSNALVFDPFLFRLINGVSDISVPLFVYFSSFSVAFLVLQFPSPVAKIDHI